MPPAYGGLGLGTTPEGALALLDVLRWIGHGSLPLGRLYEGHVNALALIARFGNASQIELATRDADEGVLFGVWNTQASDGLALEETQAGRRLQGRKTFASGAGFVGRPLVTATVNDGGVVMVLPRPDRETGNGRRADLSDWCAHGMRASATGSYDFSGLAVSANDIIGNKDDYHREPNFSAGAWRFATVQLGGIERLLDEARLHLRQAGRSSDPHQLARAGEAAVAAETAKLWVTRAAELAEQDEGRDPEQVIAYVNLARSAVERAGLDVLELVHRSVGLAGFLRTHPIERLSRDLATYLRQPAPDRALTTAAAYVLGRDTPAADLWS